MEIVKKIVKIIFIISAVVFIAALFMKDRLPGPEKIAETLAQAPGQSETDRAPFTEVVDETEYTVTPLFNYELNGLVVAYHHAESWWDVYHRAWGDAFNKKDLCVIWGETVATGVYEKMNFNSGSWTCYIDFKSGSASEDWEQFSGSEVSNNHLITTDPAMSDAIMAARRGDVIHFTGYLANYAKTDGTFERGSSTTREDTGNGACETVYVTDFEIIRPANREWRLVYEISKYMVLGCLAGMALLFWFTPMRRDREVSEGWYEKREG